MGSKYSKETTSKSDSSNSSHDHISVEKSRIPFAALQEATNNFDESLAIAEGGFGKVYRGVLCDGTKVALKRCNARSQQGLVEFRTEIEMLFQFRHPYVVPFIGYCDENNEMILVYEYMENGNLKSHLYGSNLPTLSWEQRLEICIGAAKGLHYLHTASIIHHDVKSTNILLDENFVAKVADFGLSKKIMNRLDQTMYSTKVKGTFGYVDPEYFMRRQLTEKSDVYSFGVVLFEVLCARRVIELSSNAQIVHIVDWALELDKKGRLEQIIDLNLVGKIRPDSLRKFGEIARKCLSMYGKDRPSMGKVLWNLEYALRLQESAIQHNFEDNNTLSLSKLSPQINDFSHVDVNASVAQIETSNLDDLSMKMDSLGLIMSDAR